MIQILLQHTQSDKYLSSNLWCCKYAYWDSIWM